MSRADATHFYIFFCFIRLVAIISPQLNTFFMPKLYIAAGHQGGETGTRGPAGQREELIAKDIADLAGKEGVGTVPHLKLADRVRWINTNLTADQTLIELHMDSRDGLLDDDFGVYYYGGSDFAKGQAEKLAKAYSQITGVTRYWIRPDTSSRFGRLGIIRDTKPVAFILEMADIDIPPEKLARLKALFPQFLSAANIIALGSDPDAPSDWAAHAWGELYRNEQMRSVFAGVKPRDEVSIDLILKSLAAADGDVVSDAKPPLTAERWAVIMDRLGLLT